MYDILKYKFHKNGFAFIAQDYGWNLTNEFLDCSLFYKDSLHLLVQGNIKRAESIVSTLTARKLQKQFSSNNRNTYGDVSKQFVLAIISFFFKEETISVNDSNHVTARSILVLSNVSGTVKRLYQCRLVKVVCSSNVSKQSACIVRSA